MPFVFFPRRPASSASWRGAECAATSSSVKPSRWRLGVGGRSATAFFNKRCCLLLVCGVDRAELLLAGRGGEEMERSLILFCKCKGGAFVCVVLGVRSSLCLLLWPAVAARGGAAGAWRRRFGVGCAGGLLLRLGFVRPWWCGERRLEVGVGGGPGRRCTGGKMGGVGVEELWPCSFFASDSVACGGWTLRPSTKRGGSSSPAGSRYGGAGGV